MMRGVTTPEGPPSPLKFFAASYVALWKLASVRICPFAPRYRPVNGLRQLAVQLKSGFGAPFMVSCGKDRKFSTSFALFKINSGWLNTLKTSILSSRLVDSHLG